VIFSGEKAAGTAIAISSTAIAIWLLRAVAESKRWSVTKQEGLEAVQEGYTESICLEVDECPAKPCQKRK